MTPGVFINCSRQPFIQRILDRKKRYETRTRRTLDAVVGQRVYLVETGRGPAKIVASAVIASAVEADKKTWRACWRLLGIDRGSRYDWQPETRKKFLYGLEDVQPVPATLLQKNAVRHGRVWCEIDTI